MDGKRFYLASGWFSESQKSMLEKAKKALTNNNTVDVENSYIPLDNQYKGLLVENDESLLHDVEWQTGTFFGDCGGVDYSDFVLALIDSKNVDEGTAWEMGYAFAQHKPVVVVINSDEPLNLMIAKGCAQVINIDELADFNFKSIKNKPFEGAVF